MDYTNYSIDYCCLTYIRHFCLQIEFRRCPKYLDEHYTNFFYHN